MTLPDSTPSPLEHDPLSGDAMAVPSGSAGTAVVAMPQRALEESPSPFGVAPSRRSSFVAAVLGWLVPGLGHVYAGQPKKGLYLFIPIVGLFVLGLYLTGFLCVDPKRYSLEFIAHSLLGVPTALVLHFGERGPIADFYPHFEVGRLYCAIAGLLNVIAICDVMGHVLERNQRSRRHQAWLDEQAKANAVSETQEVNSPPSVQLDPNEPAETFSTRQELTNAPKPTQSSPLRTATERPGMGPESSPSPKDTANDPHPLQDVDLQDVDEESDPWS